MTDTCLQRGDLPGPACPGQWGWWARWRSRQRRRPSREPCFPILPGGKTTTDRQKEEGRSRRRAKIKWWAREWEFRGGWRLRDKKRDSVRSNSLHTAHPNIDNLSLPPSPVLVPLSVICCKGTLCEFQWYPASLLSGCCVDSWMDKGVSALLSILPISPSNSSQNHVAITVWADVVLNCTSNSGYIELAQKLKLSTQNLSCVYLFFKYLLVLIIILDFTEAKFMDGSLTSACIHCTHLIIVLLFLIRRHLVCIYCPVDFDGKQQAFHKC